MVMDENDAKRKYRAGIDRIGIDAYRRASDKDTASEAAKVLEDAKTDEFDSASFAERYADNY